MKRFENKKLVRDNIVKFLEDRGIKTTYRYLDDKEYVSCLKAKLIEEANEVSEETEHEDIIKEISDVYEVLEILAKTLGISVKEILRARDSKRNQNGAFKEKIYLEYVELEDNHPDMDYYLHKFERYPECKSN